MTDVPLPDMPEPQMITPDGVLVYDGPPHTNAWYETRRGGITGTDLPKILGLSKWGNSLTVWMDKRGEWDDEAGEAAQWGTIFEDPIAQEWAHRRNTTVREVGIIANRDEPWVRASLDRLVHYCPDTDDDGVTCGLEVKTRSAFKAGTFRDDIPDDVLAQVMWGLYATGLDHMHVAVLIGGQKLHDYRVDREPKVIEYLVDAAKHVWQCVLDGDPPHVHPDAEGVLVDVLNRMYADREGAVELPPEAVEWMRDYRSGMALEHQAKEVKNIAKGALLQFIKSGDTGLLDNAPAFTYLKPEPSEEISNDALAAMRKDSPTLYETLVAEGYVHTTKPGPRFSLKWREPKED